MGGIGKTELALQYALEHLEIYPGGICWLRAREEIATQIVLFSRTQNRTPPEDVDLATQVGWCWSNWPQQPTLLVFDDVQQWSDIQPVLPPSASQFKVLLTSRAKFGSPIQRFEIKLLSEKAALDLLRSLVKDCQIDADLEISKKICAWLGYLPLGLELVGRYLRRKPDLSVVQVWQRLQNKRLDAQALEKDSKSIMTATSGVVSAFELSWQALTKPAQQLTAVLSLFALAEIPWSFVERCFPEVEPETLEDLRDDELVGLSLLTRTGNGMYELHQLLREFFAAKREQMNEKDSFREAFEAVIFVEAENSVERPQHSLIAECAMLIPHLQEIVLWRETTHAETEAARGMGWLATLYNSQGLYSEAEPLLLRSIDILEQQLGVDHPDFATSLNNLATLYFSQGQYSKVEPLDLRSLEIRERQLGADHPHVATSLNNLANLYNFQGRYSEAETLLLQSLKIRERQLGTDHPHVATSLNNLANLYESQGRYSEAETLLLQSLKIRERQLGADHPDVATSLNGLAKLYFLQGNYIDAEPLFLRSLEIREQQLGKNHPDVGESLNNLALLYESQGCFNEAEVNFQRSLEIRERQLGADHPDVAQGLNNLAGLYYSQGRYSKAESFLLRSREILERKLGKDHPDVALCLNNLAALYQKQGRYSEAEPLYVRSLEIYELQLGADYPNVATSLNNLAMLYDSMAESSKLQGRYLQVAEYLEKAITLRSRLLRLPH